MRRPVSIVLAVLVTLVGAYSLAGSRGKMDLKVGQEIMACDCDNCPCQTLSNNAGKCSCGRDLVKATVSSVKDGKAMLKAPGWEKERPFALAAAYACACDEGCPCNTQSQNPGKCTCGKEMKKVEM
jgi:hypothetical protein